MTRRDFMIGATAVTGLTAASSTGWAQTREADKRARIAVMMFGLNSIVKTNMPPSPARTIRARGHRRAVRGQIRHPQRRAAE